MTRQLSRLSDASGGRTVTVSQQDACWNDLLAALDRKAAIFAKRSEAVLPLHNGREQRTVAAEEAKKTHPRQITST